MFQGFSRGYSDTMCDPIMPQLISLHPPPNNAIVAYLVREKGRDLDVLINTGTVEHTTPRIIQQLTLPTILEDFGLAESLV